jgi:hypothetical protein
MRPCDVYVLKHVKQREKTVQCLKIQTVRRHASFFLSFFPFQVQHHAPVKTCWNPFFADY